MPDFIAFEKATLRKPKLGRIAASMGVSSAEALVACLKFWCWADDLSEDGNIPHVTSEWLDSEFGQGFAAVMVAVKWLKILEDGIFVPEWDKHNLKSAKARHNDARAMARRRWGRHGCAR